ncbi:Hydrolase [Candidatus Burkholderia verschuerenii]|uniref:Hydrolase n=1 Tax=Candidatus Burkholderia verschuerenii TaxID=242163 RepID=A0A0L0MEI7_9BURK|nr:HAD family phosphatase [Candidatus Burkholderia verschuerenii]KND60394.1 Hydrolase [Candidatus Burkholderia verschuerenii]
MTLTSSRDASLEDRLLICDCDGVLIDSEAVAAHMLVTELEALWPGVDVEPVLLPLLGLRIEAVLASAADTVGRTLTHEQVISIRRAVEVAAMQAPTVPGIAEALAAVPFTKACASNSFSSYVESVLNRTGLVRFFGERRFCADMVENPKPASDVYLAAARAMKVDPLCCLVVEDSVTGVTAARAAGMQVLGFIGGGHATDGQIHTLMRAGAEVVFDDMSRLPQLVEQWLANAAFEIR